MEIRSIQEEAKEFLEIVNNGLQQIKQPHFEIAFRLRGARDLNFVEALNYKDIYELAEAEFGFARTSTKNYIAVSTEYMSGKDLLDRYQGYSFTQLVEMLSINSYERFRLNASMTIKQIREWKKNNKIIQLPNGNYECYSDLSEALKHMFDNKEVKKDVGQSTDQIKENGSTQNFQDFEKNIKIAVANEPIKSKLLNLKNDDQRKDFIDSYLYWGVWLFVPAINLTCYKYVFANGDELVVSEYGRYWEYGPCEYNEEIKYHLVTKEKPLFDFVGTGQTYVLDYLTKKRQEI